jgi:hypothetical protein
MLPALDVTSATAARQRTIADRFTEMLARGSNAAKHRREIDMLLDDLLRDEAAWALDSVHHSAVAVVVPFCLAAVDHASFTFDTLLAGHMLQLALAVLSRLAVATDASSQQCRVAVLCALMQMREGATVEEGEHSFAGPVRLLGALKPNVFKFGTTREAAASLLVKACKLWLTEPALARYPLPALRMPDLEPLLALEARPPVVTAITETGSRTKMTPAVMSRMVSDGVSKVPTDVTVEWSDGAVDVVPAAPTSRGGVPLPQRSAVDLLCTLLQSALAIATRDTAGATATAGAGTLHTELRRAAEGLWGLMAVPANALEGFAGRGGRFREFLRLAVQDAAIFAAVSSAAGAGIAAGTLPGSCLEDVTAVLVEAALASEGRALSEGLETAFMSLLRELNDCPRVEAGVWQSMQSAITRHPGLTGANAALQLASVFFPVATAISTSANAKHTLDVAGLLRFCSSIVDFRCATEAAHELQESLAATFHRLLERAALADTPSTLQFLVGTPGKHSGAAVAVETDAPAARHPPLAQATAGGVAIPPAGQRRTQLLLDGLGRATASSAVLSSWAQQLAAAEGADRERWAAFVRNAGASLETAAAADASVTLGLLRLLQCTLAAAPWLLTAAFKVWSLGSPEEDRDRLSSAVLHRLCEWTFAAPDAGAAAHGEVRDCAGALLSRILVISPALIASYLSCEQLAALADSGALLARAVCDPDDFPALVHAFKDIDDYTAVAGATSAPLTAAGVSRTETEAEATVQASQPMALGCIVAALRNAHKPASFIDAPGHAVHTAAKLRQLDGLLRDPAWRGFVAVHRSALLPVAFDPLRHEDTRVRVAGGDVLASLLGSDEARRALLKAAFAGDGNRGGASAAAVQRLLEEAVQPRAAPRIEDSAGPRFFFADQLAATCRGEGRKPMFTTPMSIARTQKQLKDLAVKAEASGAGSFGSVADALGLAPCANDAAVPAANGSAPVIKRLHSASARCCGGSAMTLTTTTLANLSTVLDAVTNPVPMLLEVCVQTNWRRP